MEKNERAYIDYLIKNVDNMDTDLLADYLDDQIDFDTLVESIDSTEFNIWSYTTFLKSRKIDELLK